MKVFISVGMTGRKAHEVEADLERARKKIREIYGDNVVIVDNWNIKIPKKHEQLWYLGEAIKKLGECNACYFVDGWTKYRGCRIEYAVCSQYGITRHYESKMIPYIFM